MKKDINFALVETKRPAMYTAMKYWGKKPHNIWSEYIKTYTNENDIVLDPFSGSSIAAFEAFKLGRKAIALDINPLTSFLIEVYATSFDIVEFKKQVVEIEKFIKNDEVYQKFYYTKCPSCEKQVSIQHFKWNKGKIFEYGIICPECGKRIIITDVEEVNDIASKMSEIDLKYWYPSDEFYDFPSFTVSFKKNIGGSNFSKLWTTRNLYVLSKIFDYIIHVENVNIQKQLLFGFIQTLHLASKMCVPRSKKSNRDFSTSWGRSAYICSDKQMEMNPLLLFINNCLGKQSVQSALTSVRDYLGRTPKVFFVHEKIDIKYLKDYDILYGTTDIKKLDNVIPSGDS
ncbi:MAG: DNA methyltransferase [Thomasclavelia sp.]